MERQSKGIAFICIENARRSQMAQGFTEALGQREIAVYSARSRPSPSIDPLVIEVMKEKGIDLSSKRPKSLNELQMDYLITMGARKLAQQFRQERSSNGKFPIQKESPLMTSGGLEICWRQK